MMSKGGNDTRRRRRRKILRFWSIGIAFSKAKSIENGGKLSKFSPAAASDQDLRSEEGAKQGGIFHKGGGNFPSSLL